MSQVAVFGGGSFGTAMAACLANQKKDMDVILLLRDQGLCDDINLGHCNSRYLPVSVKSLVWIVLVRDISYM